MVELFWAGKALFPDGIVLEVVPDPLIRVEFRGVGGEVEETEAIPDGLRKRLHTLRPVCGIIMGHGGHGVRSFILAFYDFMAGVLLGGHHLSAPKDEGRGMMNSGRISGDKK